MGRQIRSPSHSKAKAWGAKALSSNVFFSFIILSISLFLFLPSVGPYPFHLPDDISAFSANPHLQVLTWGSWWTLVSHVQVREYLPVGWTFVFIETLLLGLKPISFRLVSAVLHITCGQLVFFIARYLFRNPALAFGVSILFVIHPVNAEAVIVVSSQFWQLSVLFALISILLFIHGNNRNPTSPLLLGLSVFTFVLGVFSKSGVTILPMILVWVSIFALGNSIRRTTILTAPFFLVAFVKTVVAYFFSFGEFSPVGYLGGDPLTSAISHLPNVFSSIRNLVFPIVSDEYGTRLSLSFVYPFSIPVTPAQTFKHLIFGLIAALFLFLLWICTGRTKIGTLGLLWFCTNQALFSGVVPGQYWPQADRYSYLGGIGFFILILEIINNFHSKPKITSPWVRRGLYASVFFFIFFYSQLSFIQQRIWLSREKAANMYRLNLKDDPAAYLNEFYRALETAKFSLQALPLNENLDVWNFVGPNFVHLLKIVNHHESRYTRVQSEYYFALVLAAINARRTNSSDSQALEKRREQFSQMFQRNPSLDLYSALYFLTIGDETRARRYLVNWKQNPANRLDMLGKLFAQQPPDRVKAIFLRSGNYYIAGELMNNFWLYFELTYRLSPEKVDVERLKHRYSVLYPDIWRMKNAISTRSQYFR